MDRTAAFYSQPSYVSGAGNIYAGARRQRGGSILGALKSVVAPLISGIGRSLKRNVMKNAVGFASDVVGDLSSGKNIKSSLIRRGKERGLRTLQDMLPNRKTQARQTSKRSNVRRRKQRGSGKKRVKKRASSRKPSRKRRVSSKRMPSAKRRRLNF